MLPKRFAIPDLEKYRESLGDDIIYVNDLPMETEADHEYLISLVLTHYKEDYIPVTRPSESPFMQRKDPSVWIKPPKGIEFFIVPRAYLILNKHMTYKSVNVFRWLIDPNYKTTKEPLGPWLNVAELDLPRSYTSFIKHFDEIMEAWFSYFLNLKNMKDKEKDFMLFIKKYRKILFVKALPIPNKMSFVRETNSTGDYGDISVMTHAIDAVNTIASLANVVGNLTLRRAESKVIRVLDSLGEYYNNHIRLNSSGKTGNYRKHFFGASMSFSARAIITSTQNTADMIDPRDPYNPEAGLKYEDVILPWGVALELFRIHISTLLIRRGYTPIEISTMYAKHTRYYSELLNGVMEDVISDHPLGKFPALIQRNPSLERGSTQQVFIPGFKKDPLDNSYGISNLIITAMNADFDGDECNSYLCIDDKMYKLTIPLQPHYGIRNIGRPRQYNVNVQIPKPSIATLASWERATAEGI